MGFCKTARVYSSRGGIRKRDRERERERGARGRARGMKESYSVQVLVRD